MMQALNQKIAELSRAIYIERLHPAGKDRTDILLKECITLLSESHMHKHDGGEEPELSDKYRNKLLMEYALDACIVSGVSNKDESERSLYINGHVDGQRKMFRLLERMARTLRHFKKAHPCSDSTSNICPTNREAENVLREYDEWTQIGLPEEIVMY